MLQLFEDHAIAGMQKAPGSRAALWSAVIHTTAVLFILSLSLSPAVRSLPNRLSAVFLVAPPPPAPPPAPLQSSRAQVAVRRPVRAFTGALVAPVAIPKDVAEVIGEVEAPPELGVVGGVPGGIPGGIGSSVLGTTWGGMPTVIEPPPPPPPAVVVKQEPAPAPKPPQRITVKAEIQEAKLIEVIRPEYPLAAKVARIQGIVRLRAMIDKEGKITELEVLEGHPLLAPAAREAVQRWRYQPTFLDGIAVPVATEVIVNFRLT